MTEESSARRAEHGNRACTATTVDTTYFSERRNKREQYMSREKWWWKYLDECPDHDESEPCPRCGAKLKEDPIGGFYLKCPNCGWEGW